MVGRKEGGKEKGGCSCNLPGFAVIGQPMASCRVRIVLVSRWLMRYEPPLNVPTSSCCVEPAPVNSATAWVSTSRSPRFIVLMSLTTFCAVDLTGFAVAGPLSTSRYELDVLIAPGLRFVSSGNEVWVGGADCGGGLKLPFRWLEGCESRGGGTGTRYRGSAWWRRICVAIEAWRWSRRWREIGVVLRCEAWRG